MSKNTVILGIALLLLGLIGVLLAPGFQLTALIPAFFGAILLVLGIVGLGNEGARKHVIHAAMGLALLGVLGTIRSVPVALYMVSVGTTHVERPLAAIMQAIMAVLCVVYLFFGIKSFIDARKRRESAA